MNKLILIRGVSGSGKSTLAKKMSEEIPNSIVVEADQFFEDETGHYRFDHSQIKIAHQWCEAETARLLRQGKTVITANTFCKLWEMDFYKEFAHNNGIALNITIADGNYKNVHNVPDEVVQSQRERFEYN